MVKIDTEIKIVHLSKPNKDVPRDDRETEVGRNPEGTRLISLQLKLEAKLMKLCYRGVTYDYNPPEVETTIGEVAGKYRGLDWRFRNLKKPPVLQPRVDLTYRGVRYSHGTISATQNTESTKTPVLTTRDKARALMLNHLRALKNRQQTMLHRAAADVGLVAYNC